jgi:hypothetical protein
MRADKCLKKELLHGRRRYAAEVASVLDALRRMDPDAAMLELPEAWASRDLTDALWNALPEERDAPTFESEEALTEQGAASLVGDLEQQVVLHLGRGTFAVRCTLPAAWYPWPAFCRMNTDGYNACVYPDSFGWYIVRAGTNLYVMTCTAAATDRRTRA